ncbi:type II toxin-antitoxin system RelE/ParE family toxin [Candidatus Uhrbacteria bacterium]|nr:type II toxin-antitoxin system RelE/ParE family toxin [Candidatus Uhrbacteria bacterium]
MVVAFFDKSIEEFVEGFEKPIRSRIARTIMLLERFGNRITMPYSKNVEHNLFELRTMGNPAIRIFYTFHGSCAVLLCGYIKKYQKIPRKEFLLAIKKLHLLTEYNVNVIFRT